MKRNELTKTFMIISNRKNLLVSMAYAKVLQALRVNPLSPHDALFIILHP